jgi:16S rRNA (cytosine1402-N4)-methyltransferase
MVEEVLELFGGKQIQIFVDCNLGVGGHSKAILEHHPEIELALGIDKDINAIQLAKEHLEKFKDKLQLVHGDFVHFDVYLKQLGIEKVDGVLFDLGVSSMQLDEEERGFSFRVDGPLDMRMDQSNPLTAASIVNTWPKEKLLNLFQVGDVKNYKQVVTKIVEWRRKKRIETTFDLLECLSGALKKTRKHNSATLVFQALRMATNHEIEHLEKVLPHILKHLRKDAIAVFLSFQSIEDRIIKHFIRQMSATQIEGKKLSPKICNLTKKPLTPTIREIKQNRRSSSCKLRAFKGL